jgi:DNA-directed RNA polymerase subunit RPC12/RpoP
MPVTEYKCKYCKKAFDFYKEALVCEKNHLRVLKTRPLTYGIINAYPVRLEAEFPDGAKVIYIQEEDYWRR